MSQTAVSGIWATKLMFVSHDICKSIQRIGQEFGTDLGHLQAEKQMSRSRPTAPPARQRRADVAD